VGKAHTMREDSNLIRLDGAVVIENSAELKATLLAALEAKEDVHISAEGVSELDLTGIQLLWAAARAAHDLGVGFGFDGDIPDCVSTAFSEAGLDVVLRCQATCERV